MSRHSRPRWDKWERQMESEPQPPIDWLKVGVWSGAVGFSLFSWWVFLKALGIF